MVDSDIANENAIDYHHKLANMLGIQNMLLKHDKYARITRFDYENNGKPWTTYSEF